MSVRSLSFGLGDFAPVHLVEAITEDVRRELARQIAAVAYAEWVRLAQERLTGTRADYLAGIQQPKLEGNDAVVALVGALPNAVENEQPQYDMHDTLLGPNVPVVGPGGGRGKRQKKDGGYYRAIPFRHQTPGTVGVVGRPMGSAHVHLMGRVRAEEMGRSVHEEAKDLAATTGGPWKLQVDGKGRHGSRFAPTKRGTSWGGRLRAGTVPKLANPTTGREHHSDIYAGMVRMQKTYRKATQSHYMTFRTISTNSPGWIRKATPGVKLLPQVAKFTEEQGALLIRSFLDGFAGKRGGGSPA